MIGLSRMFPIEIKSGNDGLEKSCWKIRQQSTNDHGIKCHGVYVMWVIVRRDGDIRSDG